MYGARMGLAIRTKESLVARDEIETPTQGFSVRSKTIPQRFEELSNVRSRSEADLASTKDKPRQSGVWSVSRFAQTEHVRSSFA